MKKLIKSRVLILCLTTISLIEAMHAQAHVEVVHEYLPEAKASFFRSENISNHPPVEAMALPRADVSSHVNGAIPEAQVVGIAHQPSKESVQFEKVPEQSAKLSPGQSTMFGSPLSLLNRPMTQEQQQNLWKFKQKNLGLKLPFTEVKAPKIVLATPAAEHVIIGEEPIVVHNAQGKKISEHFVNHDKSEQNTFYNSDGSSTITILDSNKIKQQEITKMPDKTQIIKYYDERGKLESIETILPDGSRVHKNNNWNGDIIGSEIYNKQNQLETRLTHDDYGRITTMHYNPDGEITNASSIFELPEGRIIINDGRIIDTFVNTDNSRFIIVYSHDGITRNQGIIVHPDGSKSITVYQADGQTTAEFTKVNLDLSYISITYQADGQTQAKIEKYNPDDETHSYITYKADGKTIKSTSVINYSDGTSRITEYQSDGKRIKNTEIANPDGSKSYTIYQPDGKTINKTGTVNIDGSRSYEIYQADGITIKAAIKPNRDNTANFIEYQADGKKFKAIYKFNIFDGTGNYIEYEADGITIKPTKVIDNHLELRSKIENLVSNVPRGSQIENLSN